MKRVSTVLGTMEMGRGPCVNDVPSQMVAAFLGVSGADKGADTHLDSAFMYCGGETERVLGTIDSWKTQGSVATKVNPWEGKGLGEASIRSQVKTSLERLQVPSVKILYLHAPDHETPLKETLRTMDSLHKEGKFEEFGLSNFSAWLVAEVVNQCKQNQWVLPTVYQGMYSAITRQVETELIPCLRYYGIRFYAYSPLAGGILTGKYKFEQHEQKTIETGRFNGIGWDKAYRDRYWKKEHFDAINELRRLLKEHHSDENVEVAEAAFRWIYNHSALDGAKGDAVIIGSSRVDQLKTNMDLVGKGPLAKPVVNFFDEWWKNTKHLCPNYGR